MSDRSKRTKRKSLEETTLSSDVHSVAVQAPKKIRTSKKILTPEEIEEAAKKNFLDELTKNKKRITELKKQINTEYSKELIYFGTILSKPTLEALGDENKQLKIFCYVWKLYTEGVSFTINKYLYTDPSNQNILENSYFKDQPTELATFIKTKTPKLIAFDEGDYYNIGTGFLKFLDVLLSELFNDDDNVESILKEFFSLMLGLDYFDKYDVKIFSSRQEFYSNINQMCLFFTNFFDLSFKYQGEDTYIYTVKENETKRFLRGIHDKPMTTIKPQEKSLAYTSTTIDKEIAEHFATSSMYTKPKPEQMNETDPSKITDYIEEIIPEPGTKCIDMNFESKNDSRIGIRDFMMENQVEFIFNRGLTVTTELPFEEHPEFPKIIQRHISSSTEDVKGGKKNKNIRKTKKIMNNKMKKSRKNISGKHISRK